MSGLDRVSLVIKKGRLRWFGHVECKDNADWIKCRTMREVDGIRWRGRPRNTWWDGGREDMERFGLSREDEQDLDR